MAPQIHRHDLPAGLEVGDMFLPHLMTHRYPVDKHERRLTAPLYLAKETWPVVLNEHV